MPIGFPISLDATASGLQLLAALSGDRSAAELCNVVNHPDNIRADSYTLIYRMMLNAIGEAAQIDRDQVKKAIMTSLYGSTAQPKKVFGEGDLLVLFNDTMAKVAPASWKLNQAFLEIWDNEALSNDWVLPDNFHVHIKIMAPVTMSAVFMNAPRTFIKKVNMPVSEGRSLGANTIHSIDGMVVREMLRRCDYDPYMVEDVKVLLQGGSFNCTSERKQEADHMVPILWGHYKKSGYLSARILEHLTPDTIALVDNQVIQEMMDSLPEKPFKVLTVHDCFRCLPKYGNDLRAQYNRQLYEIARSNLLDFIMSQLVKREVSVGKHDPDLYKDVLTTNYALS
jgi:hypothetical protein